MNNDIVSSLLKDREIVKSLNTIKLLKGYIYTIIGLNVLLILLDIPVRFIDDDRLYDFINATMGVLTLFILPILAVWLYFRRSSTRKKSLRSLVEQNGGEVLKYGLGSDKATEPRTAQQEGSSSIEYSTDIAKSKGLPSIVSRIARDVHIDFASRMMVNDKEISILYSPLFDFKPKPRRIFKNPIPNIDLRDSSTPSYRKYTLIEVKLPQKVPHIFLDFFKNSGWGKGGLSDFLKNAQRIDLGGVDDHFAIYANKSHQIEALSIITPDVMAALLDVEHDFDIEFVEDRLYIIKPGLPPFDPEGIAKYIDAANKLVDVFYPVLSSYSASEEFLKPMKISDRGMLGKLVFLKTVNLRPYIWVFFILLAISIIGAVTRAVTAIL